MKERMLSAEQRRLQIAQSVMLGGLAIYWLFILPLPWDNSGGWGDDLPYNFLAWCAISGLSAAFWLISPPGFPLTGTPGGKVLFTGAILMTLPLLWSPTVATAGNAATRLVGLWAALAFWFTLRQCHFSAKQRRILLYCLAIAAVVEAGLVLAELYLPPGTLPEPWDKFTQKFGRGTVGVFQQVNVTASFLATGLATSLFMLGLHEARLPVRGQEIARRYFLMFACVLLPAVLVLIYSRIGWLGGIVVIAGLFYLFSSGDRRGEAKNQYLLIVLPLTGIALGVLLMNMSLAEALDKHNGSNHQRLLTLYYSLRYAFHHPLIGYGAGTYESSYQNFLAALPGGNPGHELMAHPHNELLYQFTEGGIVALAGVLLWGGLYLYWWRESTSVMQRGALICMLPVLLHTQVEYPLYYSVPHVLALLIMVYIAEPEVSAHRGKKRSAFRYLSQAGMLLLSVYGTVTSYQAFNAGRVLDKFEIQALSSPESITTLSVPWFQTLRYRQDLSLLRLIRFRYAPDTDSLVSYVQENTLWLSAHTWPRMYENQIAVLQYLGRQQQAQQWEEKAHRTLPWEKAFLLKKPQAESPGK